MIICAIDPGYDRVGIALLEKNGSDAESLLFSECFITDRKESIDDRIFVIANHIETILHTFKPTVLAIETVFFSTNQKTVTSVGEAKGVIKYIAKKNALQIIELTPLQIKLAITGDGRADKSRVSHMVQKIMKLDFTQG